MPIPKVSHESPRHLLRDGVHDRLRHAIVSGELAPGSALVDADLEKRFGVSRTPLREAIMRLSNAGLVEVLPQKGTRVTSIESDRVLGSLYVMSALVPAVIHEAVSLLTESDLEAIQVLRDQIAGTADVLERATLSSQLFDRYLTAYGNAQALRLQRSCAPHLDRAVVHFQEQIGHLESPATLDSIVDATCANDPDNARDAATAYFDTAEEVVKSLFQISDDHPTPPQSDAPPLRRLLRDSLYETIKNAILDGTLEPGEKLRDEELQAWLSASQTPIKQALARLNEDGIVVTRPGKTPIVAPLDFRSINEALFVSGVLHAYSARRVAYKLPIQSLRELERNLELATTAEAASDLAVLGQAIRDFFLVFEYATGNRVLIGTAEALTLQLQRFLTPRSNLTPTSSIVEQMRAIADAASDRNSELISSLIYNLYEPTRDTFRNAR